MASIQVETDLNENDDMKFGLFFALLALVILLISAFSWQSKAIQADLLAETNDLLDSENLSWVEASMDGRDLTVAGIPPNAQAQQRATELVNSINGIRVVHNNLGLSGNTTEGDNAGDSTNTMQKLDPQLEVNASLSTNTRCQKSIDLALNNEKIGFQINTSETLESSHPLLSRLVEVAPNCKGIKLTIAGYTDSQGSAKINLKLSQARAAAIKQHLIKNGFPEDLVTTVGFGESNPIADNNTRSGRAKNRRIEISTGG